MSNYPPGKRFIPLSDAAEYAGVTPEHLNLLARQGKLKAEKVGRNWFTTKQWVDEYLGNDQGAVADKEVELRRIEMEEKVELAKVHAEVEKARLEQSGGSYVGTDRADLQQNTDGTLELVNLLAREVKNLREELNDEQGQKQALLFAFEHLQEQVKEDIERQTTDLYYQLNDKFVNLILENENQREQQSDTIPDEEKKRFFEFFIRQLNQIKNRIEDLERQRSHKSEDDPIKQLEKIKALLVGELEMQQEENQSAGGFGKMLNSFNSRLVMFKDENWRAQDLVIRAFQVQPQVEHRIVFLPSEIGDRVAETLSLRTTSRVEFEEPPLLDSFTLKLPKLQPHTSFVLGLFLLALSFGTTQVDLGEFVDVRSAAAAFGTEELMLAEIGIKTGEEFLTAFRQVPEDISSALTLFSPAGTIYDPRIYDYAEILDESKDQQSQLAQFFDQPLVDSSPQPVNLIESIALNLAHSTRIAVDTVKLSYETTLQRIYSGEDNTDKLEAQVAGSRVKSQTSYVDLVKQFFANRLYNIDNAISDVEDYLKKGLLVR